MGIRLLSLMFKVISISRGYLRGGDDGTGPTRMSKKLTKNVVTLLIFINFSLFLFLFLNTQAGLLHRISVYTFELGYIGK